MTKSNKRRTLDDDDDHDHDDNEEGEGEGASIRIRQEFSAHRLEGGAPATAEAYARAVGQWQQLSGAIVSRTQIPPTPTAPNTTLPKPKSDTEKEEQST